MEPFLKRLAEILLKEHPHELDRVAVVLPSKRAGLHLRKYLAQVKGAPLWSPEVLDIGSFLERISGIRQGQQLEMLVLLYRTYRALNTTDAEEFGTFLEWAPVTLKDMSEVDAHLLDLDHLYRDLREYHELEEWSFRLGELSPGQERLHLQWQSTGDLHRAFTETMRSSGQATSGFIARLCAELAVDGQLNTPWKRIWFAGLNAIDPATTAVIKHLQDRGLSRLAWDADPYYADDPRQEAGRYIRRSLAALGQGELSMPRSILDRERSVRTTAAPNALAQTSYAAQRLASLSTEDRSTTCVVLADETLLLPLLGQLPPDLGPLNITMGVPLRSLPVHGLVETFFDLHVAARADGRFPLADLETLVGHPFLGRDDVAPRVINALRVLQRAHLTLEEIISSVTSAGSDATSDLGSCLAPLADDAEQFGVRLSALFAWAKRIVGQDRVAMEQLFQLAKAQRRCDLALQRADLGAMDLRTYRLVRERLLRDERLTFHGEPLRGIQIMGLLETRALDHDRVIIISANEGKLPAAASQQSWIPFELRKHHRLPLPADSEALAAYHFHRVMQLASEVDLVHNADAEGGEPSRFIAQWAHEVVGQSRTVLSERSVGAPGMVRATRPIMVEKDAAVMERLKKLCERGLSPSALGTWLRCPLDFNFKYVLGIRESLAVDGTLGSDVLGDAVHHVLQELFTPTLGTRLSPEAVADMLPRVPGLLTDRLSDHFPRKVLDHGHFRLRREMAANAIQNYLTAESERCTSSVTRVQALEHEVSGVLSNGVLLKGRCDRIDERDGSTLILDIKTGTVRPEDLRLGELTREAIGPRQRYALQLLVYAWAFGMKEAGLSGLQAGVIPLHRPTQARGEFLRVGPLDRIERSQFSAIEGVLRALVDELLDPAIPFMHDPESTYCSCCVA